MDPPFVNTEMQVSKTWQSIFIIQSIKLVIVNNSRGNSRYHFLHKVEIRELSHAFLTCSMHRERKVLVSDTQVKPSKTLKVTETSYKFSVRSWWKMQTIEVTLQGKDTPIPPLSGADSEHTLAMLRRAWAVFKDSLSATSPLIYKRPHHNTQLSCASPEFPSIIRSEENTLVWQMPCSWRQEGKHLRLRQENQINVLRMLLATDKYMKRFHFSSTMEAQV